MDMSLFIPITADNIEMLQPGEWIWDDKPISRMEHKASFIPYKRITEPIGFRQIRSLNLKHFGTWRNDKPFNLTELDDCFGAGEEWVRFEEGRFYMFKREERGI